MDSCKNQFVTLALFNFFGATVQRVPKVTKKKQNDDNISPTEGVSTKVKAIYESVTKTEQLRLIELLITIL